MIDPTFWTDGKLQQLGPDEKLVLLYMITMPGGHISGIQKSTIPLVYLGWPSLFLTNLQPSNFSQFEVQKQQVKIPLRHAISHQSGTVQIN